MKQVFVLIGWVIAGVMSYSSAQGAPDFLGAGQVTGAVTSVSPASVGGQVDGALMLPVWAEKGFWVGPRFGALWEQGVQTRHLDVHAGIQGVVWFVNAVGLGMAVDLVPWSRVWGSGTGISDSIQARFTPFVTARFLRFRKQGAWAVHVGIPYDTAYHWGVQAGLTLQLNGVPTLVREDE